MKNFTTLPELFTQLETELSLPYKIIDKLTITENTYICYDEDRLPQSEKNLRMAWEGVEHIFGNIVHHLEEQTKDCTMYYARDHAISEILMLEDYSKHDLDEQIENMDEILMKFMNGCHILLTDESFKGRLCSTNYEMCLPTVTQVAQYHKGVQKYSDLEYALMNEKHFSFEVPQDAIYLPAGLTTEDICNKLKLNSEKTLLVFKELFRYEKLVKDFKDFLISTTIDPE